MTLLSALLAYVPKAVAVASSSHAIAAHFDKH